MASKTRSALQTDITDEITANNVGGITGAKLNTILDNITDSCANLTDDVGTTANKLLQLDGTGKIPAVDGSQITGLVSTSYVAKTANYTITSSDYLVDCTANSFTVTLLTAVGNTGRSFVVKNSGTGTITIATTSSQTTDGQASGTITLSQYEAIEVISNGVNWLII